MKTIVLTLLLIFSNPVFSEDLSKWLMSNGNEGYFPEYGDYTVYKNVCSKSSCFHLVFVSYVSGSNKGGRRLAVFSEKNKYLGNYSGFNDNPIELKNSKLLFPYTDPQFGKSINIDKGFPHETIYLDGEFFDFEKEL